MKCHEHLELVIREQQNNYKLDPQLVLKCTDTVSILVMVFFLLNSDDVFYKIKFLWYVFICVVKCKTSNRL